MVVAEGVWQSLLKKAVTLLNECDSLSTLAGVQQSGSQWTLHVNAFPREGSLFSQQPPPPPPLTAVSQHLEPCSEHGKTQFMFDECVNLRLSLVGGQKGPGGWGKLAGGTGLDAERTG